MYCLLKAREVTITQSWGTHLNGKKLFLDTSHWFIEYRVGAILLSDIFVQLFTDVSQEMWVWQGRALSGDCLMLATKPGRAKNNTGLLLQGVSRNKDGKLWTFWGCNICFCCCIFVSSLLILSPEARTSYLGKVSHLQNIPLCVTTAVNLSYAFLSTQGYRPIF